jgi:hypothetical protein
MHGALFAVGLSCCTGTALGDRPQDALRVAVRVTPRSAPTLDARALVAALDVELGRQGARKVVVGVAGASERGEPSADVGGAVELRRGRCTAATEAIAFSTKVLNGPGSPVSGEVSVRDVKLPEYARVAAVVIAEGLRTELEGQTRAVAWTAGAHSKAHAAEDASGSPDPDDDEVPWWRSHLRIEAAARVGGDIWIGEAGPGVHTVSSFGAGGGASVAIDRVHLGLSAMYYLAADGSSESSALAPVEGGALYWSLLVGTEVGYDFRVGIWTFRPQLGFGAHELHAIWTDFGNAPMQRWDAYFEPGATTLLKLGFVTIGLDTNVLVVTTGAHGNTPTFTAHGQLGVALP